jgi:hypothetical protein
MTPGIAEMIGALDGPDAIRVLADTADYESRLPDPARLQAIDAGLREALAAGDGALAGYADPGTAADPGELARAALLHLAATRPELVPVIARAISLPGQDVREPVTLAVGALVVLALQTEVKLTRNADGRWAFTLHKHHMRDTTLGQVITKLIAAYLPGGK